MRVSTARDPAGHVRTCGCCGRERRRLAELGSTPGVYICRFLRAVGVAAGGLPLTIYRSG